MQYSHAKTYCPSAQAKLKTLIMNDSPKFGSNELFKRFAELSITFENHEHPPLRTVAESQALRGQLPGAHIKNLFLRDKKRRYFLVTVSEDREVDLKWLRGQIGARGSLSFGSADALLDLLGVKPGAVTPLGVVNAVDGKVTAFLDKALVDTDQINAHPLRNDLTTALSAADLLHFMEESGHPPGLIDFESDS